VLSSKFFLQVERRTGAFQLQTGCHILSRTGKPHGGYERVGTLASLHSGFISTFDTYVWYSNGWCNWTEVKFKSTKEIGTETAHCTDRT